MSAEQLFSLISVVLLPLQCLSSYFLMDIGYLHSTIKVNASAVSSSHVAFAKRLFSHPFLMWPLQWVPAMVLKNN